MKSLIILASCWLSLLTAFAEPLKLHPLFSDDAVLQQGMKVPVWGWGTPGQEVAVEFGGQKVAGTVDDSGRWQAVLAPLSLSADPQVLKVSSGGEILEVEGVLVGEVWIGSGQSNMGWAVRATLQGEASIAEAEAGGYANVRLFKVPVRGENERRDSVAANWGVPNGDSVSSFSATAFYFASELSRARSIPVGIIQSANGGTNAFSWINNETFHDAAVGETLRTHWKKTLKNFPAAMERYEAELATWKKDSQADKAAGRPVSRAPREPLGPNHVKRPTGHYNAMIAPLQPFAIRGVVWYQGEANSRMPFYPEYKDLMLELVDGWRLDWAATSNGGVEKSDFPFYLVQLPNFAEGDAEGWPRIREQMLKFWQEGEQTGMVVTIDTGDANDIHPQNKKPVGERLARFARGNIYGEDIAYSGPIFDHLQITGEKAVVHFNYTVPGLASLDGEALKYFEIADGEGNFHPAEASIEGDTVVVRCPEVKEPRAVRYAWQSNPEGANLGNKDGLPASPFRSDNW